MSEPIQATFTIQITDAHIENAIAKATSRYVCEDDDDDDGRVVPIDLKAFVEKRLVARVDKEIAKVTKEVVEETVAERVRQALDAGFPVLNDWGQEKGRKTLADLIGERIFSSKDRSDSLFYSVREEAHKLVKAQVAAAVKAATADIDKMFAEAAAEGLATMLKRKLGVG